MNARAQEIHKVMKIKPRIFRGKIFFFGIASKPMFICQSKEAYGYGKTVSEAYENWVEVMPKTIIGRFFARLVNAIF